MQDNLTLSRDRAAQAVGLALSVALLVGGLVSQVVALVPLKVGNIDWEFGALGEVAATGPLFLMGLGTTLFVATRSRRPGLVFGAGFLSLAWGLALVVGLVLLALDAPLLLTAARAMAPEPARAVKIVLAKSAGLMFIECLALLVLGVMGFRWWAALRRSTVHLESGR